MKKVWSLRCRQGDSFLELRTFLLFSGLQRQIFIWFSSRELDEYTGTWSYFVLFLTQAGNVNFPTLFFRSIFAICSILSRFTHLCSFVPVKCEQSATLLLWGTVRRTRLFRCPCGEHCCQRYGHCGRGRRYAQWSRGEFGKYTREWTNEHWPKQSW